MLLSNFRNQIPMRVLYLFRASFFSPLNCDATTCISKLIDAGIFLKRKNPPTVTPSPTPKLTKREDSAAVLLTFSDPLPADENTLPILRAVSTCMSEA